MVLKSILAKDFRPIERPSPLLKIKLFCSVLKSPNKVEYTCM